MHRLILCLGLGACSASTPDPNGDTASEAEVPIDPGAVACADLGLPVQPRVDVTDAPTLRGDPVPAFSVPVVGGGAWDMAEGWTGCDVYLFVPEEDASSRAFPETIWERDQRKFLRALPRNTQVFFFSDEDDAKQRATTLEETMQDVLSKMEQDERAWWADRLHYVRRPMGEVAGWVGEHWNRTSYGFLVDRSQQLRDIGSLADPDRFDQGAGWFGPNMMNAANEVVYANFVFDRQQVLDAEEVSTIDLLVDEDVGSKTFDITLPDAATLARFDHVDLDVTQLCTDEGGSRGPREFGTCPAWDYLAYLDHWGIPVDDNAYDSEACQPAVGASDGVEAIAADTKPCQCTQPGGAVADSVQTCKGDGSGYGECSCACTEVGRWITTYHREGRWVFDATQVLATAGGGGTQRFRYRGGNRYLSTVRLRLSSQDKGWGSPSQRVPLFTGGSFDAGYNDGREPVTVDIPADATHVELVAVISGHGFGKDQANCAEFCNHTHHFTAGSTEFVVEHPEADDPLGCVNQVDVGTVPNQFGTWFLGRGGWCPGKEVAPNVFDLDEIAEPGRPLTIDYAGKLNGQPYVPRPASGDGFGARIDMQSYLLIWR